MSTPSFFSRTFYREDIMTMFINKNNIKQTQIVTINMTKRETIDGMKIMNRLCFYSSGLEYDLGYYLPEEKLNVLTTPVIIESDEERELRLKALKAKFDTNIEKLLKQKNDRQKHSSDYWEVDIDSQISSLDKLYNKEINQIGIKTIVWNLKDMLVPVGNKLPTGNEFLDLIRELNPATEIKLSDWNYIEK